MNRQLAFNDAVKGLATQKAFSTTPTGTCRYRGVNGTKCAVGFLIPDENYYEEGIEFNTAEAYSVCEAIDNKYGVTPGVASETEFLRKMQRDLHDDLTPVTGSVTPWNEEKFQNAVRKFATQHKLENPLVQS